MSKKIIIKRKGPYIVTGALPLTEKIITPSGRGYVYREGRPLKQAGTYALCRCGRSKNAPFCDGTHEHVGFVGVETASKRPYLERAAVLEGPALDLLDDDRCAFARFCHRDRGDAWQLTMSSDDPLNQREAIRAAADCPAGRLTAVTKSGYLLEPEVPPAAAVLQDPEKNVSAGIFVQGYVPIESADGTVYEPRSRVVLCRCGRSENKPFCDASHVTAAYKDY
ncbi:CDGSH iron-sulfur domain-containing protein [Oscillospiraceae bacterium CM]|nr:CDGSH iron-sulfur domain-containing protein [Oscillospiraceae bacterium CM]